jgi:hypothetical protein
VNRVSPALRPDDYPALGMRPTIEHEEPRCVSPCS